MKIVGESPFLSKLSCHLPSALPQAPSEVRAADRQSTTVGRSGMQCLAVLQTWLMGMVPVGLSLKLASCTLSPQYLCVSWEECVHQSFEGHTCTHQSFEGHSS